MNDLATFARADVEILCEWYDVKVVSCQTMAEMFSAARAAMSASVLFCWFGSLRYLPAVLAARLAGRPIVIVAGGYDVANVAEIGYGNMQGGPTTWFGRCLFRLATLVLPFSDMACSEARTNARVPSSRLRTVPLGFDPGTLGATNTPVVKQPLLLAVAMMNPSSIERKGITTLVRASHLVPEIRFVIAGRGDGETMTKLQADAAPNVEFPGYVDDAQLAELYRHAMIYCQPSLHEGFGCAVAEAMLFNCIPVVTARGSLPEVVGSTGVYVPYGDAEALAAAIKRVVAGTALGGTTPRERIVTTFPLMKRAAALHQIIEEVI
ncbi:MAG: putative glycosyltransferase [Gemmatimonadetes bacterium]|nr:putative glycosyltransferase [Gemmatimonadota bacterium]